MKRKLCGQTFLNSPGSDHRYLWGSGVGYCGACKHGWPLSSGIEVELYHYILIPISRGHPGGRAEGGCIA